MLPGFYLLIVLCDKMQNPSPNYFQALGSKAFRLHSSGQFELTDNQLYFLQVTDHFLPLSLLPSLTFHQMSLSLFLFRNSGEEAPDR